MNDLRKRAEEKLDRKPTAEDLSQMSPEAMQHIVHDLRVHQIELEMQNKELRRAHLEIEASRNRYSDLYDFAPVGYITASEKGMIQEANLTICSMLGVERSLLIGKPFSRFITPETQDTYYFQRQKLFETKEKQSFETRLVKKDGSPFYAQLECLPVEDSGGNITQLRMALTDINARKLAQQALQKAHAVLEQRVEERTEELRRTNVQLESEIEERRQTAETLKRSKKEWETTFDAMSDWVSLIDLGSRILRTNRMGEKIVGIPPSEIIGQTCCKLLHDVETPIPGCPVQKMRQTRKRESVEFKMPDSDRWLTVTTDPVMDDDGNITGAVHIVRDITNQKKLEAELLKVQKLESVGVLAGGIAHDFNNLLAIILGNISLAEEDVTQSDILEVLNEARKASLRAKALTHQLITFSKGGAPVKKIASIAGFVKESVNSSLSGSNVRCESALPDDLWRVECDENQMGHVINNLIANAVEAMPAGGTIKIFTENRMLMQGEAELELHLQEGRYVKISIRDQGAGISEEDLPRIFDPYFSTKNRGAQKGMGLGLSSAYSIVSQHKGHISADSEVGLGTTVSIYLPAFEEKGSLEGFAEDRSSPIEQDLRSPSTINNQQSTIKRVLVMDDEEGMRRFVKQMLNRFGYAVEVAEDGNKAIELYKKAMAVGEPFDAVLLDLTVKGGMGGKQALKHLLYVDPDVKAIICSGYFNDPVMANFKDYGFYGAMPKPFEGQTLRKTVNQVVTGEDK